MLSHENIGDISEIFSTISFRKPKIQYKQYSLHTFNIHIHTYAVLQVHCKIFFYVFQQIDNYKQKHKIMRTKLSFLKHFNR